MEIEDIQNNEKVENIENVQLIASQIYNFIVKVVPGEKRSMILICTEFNEHETPIEEYLNVLYQCVNVALQLFPIEVAMAYQIKLRYKSRCVYLEAYNSYMMNKENDDASDETNDEDKNN